MSVVHLAPGPVAGVAMAPASKSYTHRALVAAYLSKRRYRIRRPLDADDTRATREGLRRLGARIRVTSRAWEVENVGDTGGTRAVAIECRESGTTLRLLAPLAALQSRRVRIWGGPRLSERPFRPLARSLERGGAKVGLPPDGRSLPTTVRGPIRSGTYRVRADLSSQFVSGLLFALPVLPGSSRVVATGRAVSRPYVRSTLAVLRYHGIRPRVRRQEYAIRGGEEYRGTAFEVPGDLSSAAYLCAAAAVSGGSVTVRGISSAWPQADESILPVLRSCGAVVERRRDRVTVEGTGLRRFAADLSDAPDLLPLCGVLASLASGSSRLSGARHARWKESDRVAETARLCRALGATALITGDSIVVRGRERPRTLRSVDSTDHRVVMSAAVAALACPGTSEVGDARAVEKSYPRFWRDLRTLGASIGEPQ